MEVLFRSFSFTKMGDVNLPGCIFNWNLINQSAYCNVYWEVQDTYNPGYYPLTKYPEPLSTALRNVCGCTARSFERFAFQWALKWSRRPWKSHGPAGCCWNLRVWKTRVKVPNASWHFVAEVLSSSSGDWWSVASLPPINIWKNTSAWWHISYPLHRCMFFHAFRWGQQPGKYMMVGHLHKKSGRRRRIWTLMCAASGRAIQKITMGQARIWHGAQPGSDRGPKIHGFAWVISPLVPYLHPRKLTWDLKITQMKRKIIFQTSIFSGIHVSFCCWGI